MSARTERRTSEHCVFQGNHFCTCGADAVTCQSCGNTRCSRFVTWLEYTTRPKGNYCESCLTDIARPLSHKPWIESVLPKVSQIRCVECSEVFHVGVRASSVHAWSTGTLIQLAMPDLVKELRELFISGTCETCFAALAKRCDEQDDETLDASSDQPADEDDFSHALEDLLKTASREDFPEVKDIESFSSAGVMTLDTGLVVRMQNGKTFYLTIQEQ